jgi:hypothetical protein
VSLARILKLLSYTGNLKIYLILQGQPGQKPGFYFLSE